jgi:sugar phosphate isomerase/epimerase
MFQYFSNLVAGQINSKMKISCLPVSLFKEIRDGKISIKEWAHEAKRAGLDAIDLSIALIRDNTPVYLESLVNDLKKEAMPLVMITSYPDFTHPDKLQREREKDYFIRDIALSSYLGAKYLRITSGQAHPETGIKTGISHAVEYFKRMNDVSNKYGIRLLYENHAKPGAWKYSDFSMPFEIFSEIAEKIKDTGIGINLDLGNLLACGMQPLPVLEEMYERIDTIHASDMKEKGKFGHAAIGSGVVPYPEIFRYLEQRGFDKWVCIEEASFRGMEGIRDAVAFIRKLI